MEAQSDTASLAGNQGGAPEDPGLALCLSGGGFRATLFHLGALRRLNELGILADAKVITSVSGGSILNGVLATQWSNLTRENHNRFTNFDSVVGSRVREFCRHDLRTKLLFGVRANPFNFGALLRDGFAVAASFLARAYEPLLQQKLLRELPTPNDGPRFVFCATSVQTGACWQFHGGPDARMGDFYNGYGDVADTSVSAAVAASSAFPPGFAGLRFRFLPDKKSPRLDPWGEVREESSKRFSPSNGRDDDVILTDGGVYDNLGVEPVWHRCKTLLVSDAGHPFESVPSVRQWVVPRLRRAAEISAEQVGAVRKRWLVGQLMNKDRKGAIWSISSPPEKFSTRFQSRYGDSVLRRLVHVRTDLNSFTDGEIGCLQNHGYWLADAAMRSYAPEICANLDATFNWPESQWLDHNLANAALATSETRHIIRDIANAAVRRIWK